MQNDSPEADLLVAICKQAADDYLTAYDELGIAMLKGETNAKAINLWRNLFDDARSFFLTGGSRELVNADDAQILAWLEAKTKARRNWQNFHTWDEALAGWAACDTPKSADHRTEMKQLHAWLIRKCEGEETP